MRTLSMVVKEEALQGVQHRVKVSAQIDDGHVCQAKEVDKLEDWFGQNNWSIKKESKSHRHRFGFLPISPLIATKFEHSNKQLMS